MSESAVTAPQSTRGLQRIRFGVLLNLTLFGLLMVIWGLLAVSTDSFMTAGNLTNLMRQFSLLAIIAIGQTFVIITGGIDLSVGAVVGLSSVIVSMLLVAGLPIPLAIFVTLLAGAGIGAIHAFGVAYMRLPPFIITLAGLTAWRGVGLLATNGFNISGLPKEFSGFSRAEFLGLPSLFWMVLLVAIPAYVLLHISRWGRYIYAVGSNAEAARLSGINIRHTIFLVYMISSTCAALAGVLAASRLSLGIATTGDTWELQAIASSVIGGTSLFGAVGSVVGPTLGSLLLSTINQGANLLNINPFWQRIVTGLLIVLIVFLDQLRRTRRN
ncbi:ABC transporter permease [Mesorhizobium sp. M0862]|uniref:ABC transporter permease n=1 Tax=Mesorhizobium sp. M0862 TaxID=2957015 RepID=UPI0033382401